MQIKEAVMPKNDSMLTFCCDSSIVTKEHEEFGLSKDISDSEALRKVNVRVVPLDWVYLKGGQLSTLFREFRGD